MKCSSIPAGEPPFTDEYPGAVLYKVMDGEHVSLVERRPDIPQLAQIIESALAIDPARRPPNALAFRRLLLAAIGRSDVTGGFLTADSSGPRQISCVSTVPPPPSVPPPSIEISLHDLQLTPHRRLTARVVPVLVVLGAMAVGGGAVLVWKAGDPATPPPPLAAERSAVGNPHDPAPELPGATPLEFLGSRDENSPVEDAGTRRDETAAAPTAQGETAANDELDQIAPSRERASVTSRARIGRSRREESAPTEQGPELRATSPVSPEQASPSGARDQQNASDGRESPRTGPATLPPIVRELDF